MVRREVVRDLAWAPCSRGRDEISVMKLNEILNAFNLDSMCLREMFSVKASSCSARGQRIQFCFFGTQSRFSSSFL